MIQRIQSVFLFLAAAALGLFSFLKPSTLFFEDIQTGLPAIVSIVGGLIAMVSIFLFKNRKLQMNIVKLSILLALAAVILLFVFGIWQLLVSLWPTYLIPGAIILLILGHRGIKKDDKLVKSLDRLR